MDRKRIGKYTIVGELGRGTMGEVYKAHDPVLNRHVALKTLPVRLGPDDETLQRFQREAQAAALLNHPNIVTVHDFGEEQGLLYMAMELLDGTDLREAIDSGSDKIQTLEQKLALMDSVLAGLDYAHTKGVVHRDIKPANIHLSDSGQVKIMDFGLARVSTSEMTQEGIVLGTPNYMSPEQALGDKVDGRSDIFSTGAVLYELLTGHKPFEADTTPSVLFQVVHKQPPPVRRWVPDLPAAVVAVVNRSLEKDLDRRFATAGDMRAALAIAREGSLPPRAATAPAPPAVPSASQRARSAPPPLPPSASRIMRRSTAVPPQLPALSAPNAAPKPAAPPAPGAADAGPGRGLPAWLTGRRPLVIGATAGALVLLLGLGLVLRGRAGARPEAGPAKGQLQLDLARTQLRLARAELDGKNYKAAIKEAQEALKLSPTDPEARAILGEAQTRLDELDKAVAEANRMLEAGDSEGAARQLSQVLELDPRHEGAAVLTAKLNSAFQAEAEAAAQELANARPGAPDAALTAAGAAEEQGRALMARGEYAEATRTFLEARDALDRARREAARRATPAPLPRPAATAATAAAVPATPAPTPATRSFSAEATSVRGPGLRGFEGAEVAGREPQFNGRMEFEVLPPAVRNGEPFVVRIHLLNEGRKTVKIRGLALAALVDGQRVPAVAKPLQKEVKAQSRALVAEYSGVWNGPREWALEAVVTADKDETVTSRLKAN